MIDQLQLRCSLFCSEPIAIQWAERCRLISRLGYDRPAGVS